MSEPPFVWQGEELLTMGDIDDAVRAIYALADPEERQRTADVFMAAYRDYTEYADVNIGYMSGYYGHDTMVAMLRLFRTSHPVFGPPALADKVTAEGAFEAGRTLGERLCKEAEN